MATRKEYLNFILEQLSPLDGVTCRQMMGEYILYYHERIAAYVCDDRLLVKPVDAARALLPNAVMEPPYEGAKPMLLVDNMDDSALLCALFEAMLPELPEPKKKPAKKRITLRPMTKADLPLFREWLAQPHVAAWYAHPEEWVREVEGQNGAFSWIHHDIAELGGRPVGFCQYYACRDSDETWGEHSAFGAYSVDYLVGDPGELRRGCGKEILLALIRQIRRLPDARRILVQPEAGNQASRALLRSCGFAADEAGIFEKEL